MKTAAVSVAVLAASFSLVAAQSATIDPSYAYYKIDMTRPPAAPTPVYVVNFPDVQTVSGSLSVDNLPAVQTVVGSVAVSNLPAVQAVEGSVNVGNLPSVQQVAGTVNVGNLPVTDDGSLRIAAGPASVTYNLLDQRVDIGSWASDWIPSGDHSTVVLAIGGNSFDCVTMWRFESTASAGWQAGPTVGRDYGPSISSGGVFGPELQVQCWGASSGYVSAVRVFLRN